MACKNSVAKIIGTGMTVLRSGEAAQQYRSDAVLLMVEALQLAVQDAGISLNDLDTLIALPSLMSDQHFMIGHAVAQQAALTPRKGMLVKTLDVGGAGPVSALLAAKHAIEYQGRQAVAIVAGDTVASVPVQEFLAKADSSCRPKSYNSNSQDDNSSTATTGSLTVDSVDSSVDWINTSQSDSSSCSSYNSTGNPASSGSGSSSSSTGSVPSPVIPNLYDRVARWHMQQYGTTRQQLAMCASLMTYQAGFHPMALQRRPRLLQEVLSSAPVAPVTTKLECAKLADGAAAIILVPADSQHNSRRAVAVTGGGEGSGPLYPPHVISEDCFSAAEAAAAAYQQAGCSAEDIQYWGLYDCFPICLIRAIEAVGLAPKGQGGSYIQAQYQRLLASPLKQQQHVQKHNHQQHQQHVLPNRHSHVTWHDVWPVNTHGGLLGFGAPWEVPAMHGLIEAVAQLRGEAEGRQVRGARRALVYGNGGVFSASAVAILERCGPASKL